VNWRHMHPRCGIETQELSAPHRCALPPEPDWRTVFSNEDDLALATEPWSFATRAMRDAGTIAVENGRAIKRLVEFTIEYERAARQVAESGAILPPSSKKTKVGQWNPHWSVMRQAASEI